MLTIVCWRWMSPVGYRSTFGPETVYALRDMVKKHLHVPHRFLCVTDRPEELKGVETIRLWDDCAAIPSPFGRHNPSCYRRLKLFAPDAGEVFGERVVSMDLDTVIVRDITPLFDTDVDFKIWGCSDFPTQWFNGSLFMLKTGSHPTVWTTFDPDSSPEISKRAGCFGSDQGWMRYVLGNKMPVWDERDGIYSFRKHLAPFGDRLPENARAVFFHGKVDPWHYSAQRFAWIREHYPMGAVA
jgi:hypothetical protein